MQEEDDSSPASYGSSGRKFGEPRPSRTYGQDTEEGSGGTDRKSRFRSRFTRHLESSFEEPEPPPVGRVRFEAPKERERVLDTEDASKGPMSGITRLFDSPKVIERIADSDRPKKPTSQTPIAPPTVAQKVSTPTPAPWRNTTTARQLSEDDEIAKQKKMNKEGAMRVDQAASGTRRQTSNEPKTPNHTASETEYVSEPPSSLSGISGSVQAAETTAPSRVRRLSPDRLYPKRSESEDSAGSTSSGTGWLNCNSSTFSGFPIIS